eukprot:CAMPEP_0194359250 /NCGR_PEP_ID=MMETSP0174-20130528/6522_1 /TAXON_ID=216777 /ORGANISM="Proboscia alata, Strain PI-D3" /LENGTH=472 /DNA_ID=CAMNT_0039130051 /DNA_START=168 /DNA_END=1586 /DNA_ORIENTATION=-
MVSHVTGNASVHALKKVGAVLQSQSTLSSLHSRCISTSILSSDITSIRQGTNSNLSNKHLKSPTRAFKNHNFINSNSSARFMSSALFTRTINSSFHVSRNNNTSSRRAFSSNNKRDFYDVLGVPRTSNKAEVKKAYFKAAKQYHPDTNKGDETAEQKFKEASEAYEILSDKSKKELYDNYGHAGVDPNNGFNQHEPHGNSGFQFHQQAGQDIDPNDLFEAFFGGGMGQRSRRRGPQRGADLQMQVQLTFMEAVFGSSKELNLRYQHVNRETGTAEIKDREVTVKTPAGIDTGMNLRLAGQGAEGDPGAGKGNLLIQVIVEEDDYFQRDGQDVHTEIPISLPQAVLGGSVDVRTLTGVVEMKIPKGCDVDAKLMLRGKGIPALNNGGGRKGNQIVHLQIQIPKKISPRQEELMREFDKECKISKVGVSGRIAKAAESAFDSIFGCKSEKKEEKKEEEPEKEFVEEGGKKQVIN